MRRVEAKKMNEEQAHLAWRPAQRHPDFYKFPQQKDPAAGSKKKDPAQNFDDLSCRNKRIIQKCYETKFAGTNYLSHSSRAARAG